MQAEFEYSSLHGQCLFPFIVAGMIERKLKGHALKRLPCLLALLFCLTMHAYATGAYDADEKSASQEPLEIRVGALKGPTGIGMIHLFSGEVILPPSVHLAMEAVASADAMAAKILSGGLDAAVLPVNMAAKLYNSGIPYRMLAVVGNGMVKVLTTDAGVETIHDLRGRDVWVAGQGASPEFVLRTILQASGLNPDSDLRMIFNMPFPEMAASMVSGKIDLAILPEPFATQVIMGNSSARVPFSISTLWANATGQDDYPMSVFVVRSELIDTQADAVRALLAAYEASIASVLSKPHNAGILVEKYDMGLKAAVAEKAIPACAFTFIPAVQARASVEALLEAFLKSSPASIGSRLPDGSWYADVAIQN